MMNEVRCKTKPEWIELESGGYINISTVSLLYVDADTEKAKLYAWVGSGSRCDTITIRTYPADKMYENMNDRPNIDGIMELYDAECAAYNDLIEIMKIISRGNGAADAVIWQEYLVMREVKSL